MNVHILATCRDISLIQGTLLVFDTLRVGFPNAHVKVHLNNPVPESKQQILDACKKNICDVSETETIHHEWIENLIKINHEPFYILDTDVIFWRSFEGFEFDCPLAGRRIPEWNDEFTKSRTRARLHTSLLYIDPKSIEDCLIKYRSKFPNTVFNPFPNLIYPLSVPFKGGAYFYDTCSMLYHAVGGQSFTDYQLDSYDHLNFGTIPDIVLPHLSDGKAMDLARKTIYKNPIQAKGTWRIQEQYYKMRQ